MNTPEPIRIDRRVAIKWMLTASAGAMLTGPRAFAGAGPDTASSPPAKPAAVGYGSDPDLVKGYKPGDLWPLTFTSAQRRQVGILCDLIIPPDDHSPGAASVGVTDYIDEFVSAPYPDIAEDGKKILDGLAWLDTESAKRYGAPFADATEAQRASLCEDISYEKPKDPALKPAADFFKRLRNLVASGFYTTPVGMKDIGYVGNVPLATFDGPPAELVAKLGLTDEVKW
jgi:hypothetical protein